MKKTISIIFVLSQLGVQSAISGGLSSSDAFNLGKDMGNTGKDQNYGGINNTNASANVPGYATSSTESQYYQDGMGSITQPANTDVQGCLSTTNDPTKQSYGHCESVRMINQSKGKARAMFALDPTKDPLITQGKTIQTTPSDYTGASTSGGTYSGCVDKQVKDPDVMEVESCNRYKTLTDQSCNIIDNVTVTKQENCVVNTWAYSNYTAWNNANNKFYLQAQCGAFNQTNQVSMQVVITAAGACGATSSSFTIAAYTPVGSPTTLPGNPTLVPDFYGVSGRCAITVQNLTYTHNGCPNNQCQTAVTFNSNRGGLTTTVLNYQPYTVTYTVTDNWDNQCAALQARAQQ